METARRIQNTEGIIFTLLIFTVINISTDAVFTVISYCPAVEFQRTHARKKNLILIVSAVCVPLH